jgi:hypothetical protein
MQLIIFEISKKDREIRDQICVIRDQISDLSVIFVGYEDRYGFGR